MAAARTRILVLLACLSVAAGGAALAGRAGTAGLLDIERGRADVISAAERFRDAAGAGYQQSVLDAVRRSCPYTQVLRLDDIPPTASSEPPEDAAEPAPSAPLFEAKFTGDLGVFEAVDDDTRVEFAADGTLSMLAGQIRTSAPLSMAKEALGTIELEAATDHPSHLLVGWSDQEDAHRLVRNKARIDLIADGRMHTYSIDASKALDRGLDAGAVVRRLFLSARGDTDSPIRVRSVRAYSWRHRYPRFGHGISYEKLGGELRRALFQVPEHMLLYEVTLPKESPAFEAGLGALGGGGVTEFRLALIDGERRFDLLKRVDNGVGWDDVRVDLSQWAGRRIRLELLAHSTSEAVALWSSPVVRTDVHEEEPPPSVVMILEDALRPDRLATYGGPVPSPGHDMLAARGVTFERAFAQAPQTRSSVPSLMTSLLPSATGTWDFSDALRDEYVTLAEVLRACGYQTASFLQNGNAGAYAGLHQGFDVVVDEEQAGTDAQAVFELARAWLQKQASRPAFAYVHVLDPHGPFDPVARPALDAGAETHGEPALEVDRAIDPEWLEKPTAKTRRALYDAEVAAVDAALGSFLRELDRSGTLARAVVALLSDHGEFLGEHGGMWRHHPPGHVQVTRVPLLLAGKGIQSGRRVATPVALLDVMPTLLALTRIDASALAMQGQSLMELRSGRTSRVIVSEEPALERGGRQAQGCGSLLSADRQFLLACISDEASLTARTLSAAEELPRPPLRIFDIAAALGAETTPDPWLHAFLETRTRDFLTSLQTINVEAWRRMTGGSDATIRTDPQQTERLRALGYAQ